MCLHFSNVFFFIEYRKYVNEDSQTLQIWGSQSVVILTSKHTKICACDLELFFTIRKNITNYPFRCILMHEVWSAGTFGLEYIHEYWSKCQNRMGIYVRTGQSNVFKFVIYLYKSITWPIEKSIFWM